MRKVIVGVFLLALAAVPAFAQTDATPVKAPVTEARTPNFLGATGLLFAPSAYVQSDRDASVYFNGGNGLIDGGAVAGIGNRFEVGVTGFHIEGGETNALVNAKFNFLQEKKSMPAISAGIIDGFNALRGDHSWYVVASKYFTRGDTDQRFSLKGHLGYGGGLFDDEIFAGAELFFDRNLSAMAEFVNDDFNIGARYTYRGFTGTVGLFDFDRIGGGVSYTAHFR
jgi:hypothetical protein